MSGHVVTRQPDLVGVPSATPTRHRREQVAWFAVMIAMVLIALKPLFDILSEKAAADVIDLGVVLTVAGAFAMGVAFALTAADLRRLPRALVIPIIAIGVVALLSVFAYAAKSGRADLLALFDDRRTSIYGGYVSPNSGILTEALRMITGFAPLLLIAVMVRRQAWFPVSLLRLVAGVVLAGALVHSVIAWLQVAGVVPYSFFFQLPQGFIGRASGGYYHPMSLGRVLIFAVLMLYILRDHLPLNRVARYALIVLFTATGAVSLHRLTLVCLAIIVAAFEVPRLGQLVRAARGGAVSRRTVGVTSAVVLVVAGFAAWQWGASIWERVVVTFTEVGSLDFRSDEFMHGRGAIWGDVIEVFGKATPDVWLFGFGYEPWDMHNDLIRIAVTWGAVGVVAVLAAFVGLFRFTARQCDRSGRYMLVVLYLTMFVFGLTQKPSSYPYFVWLFLFCHLLILAVHSGRTAVAATTRTENTDPA